MQKLLNYTYIYLIPLLLSATFSLKSFRLKWPRPYTFFSVFLCFTLLVEVFAISWKWYLFKTGFWNYSRSNLWIYNAFTVIRGLFLLVFYYQVLTSVILKKMIRVSIIIFIFGGGLNYFFIQSPHHINNYTIVIANGLTIFLSLAFFRQLLKDKNIIKLSTHPLFWISLGNFIYYSGTLPFFILFDYLLREHLPMALSYLYINDALNIVLYSFYLISFLCKPQLQK